MTVADSVVLVLLLWAIIGMIPMMWCVAELEFGYGRRIHLVILFTVALPNTLAGIAIGLVFGLLKRALRKTPVMRLHRWLSERV